MRAAGAPRMAADQIDRCWWAESVVRTRQEHRLRSTAGLAARQPWAGLEMQSARFMCVDYFLGDPPPPPSPD